MGALNWLFLPSLPPAPPICPAQPKSCDRESVSAPPSSLGAMCLFPLPPTPPTVRKQTLSP